MVAQCDRICALAKEFVCDIGGYSDSTGAILAIYDRKKGLVSG